MCPSIGMQMLAIVVRSNCHDMIKTCKNVILESSGGPIVPRKPAKLGGSKWN